MRKILLLFLLAAWFQFNTLTQAALTNLVWVGACDTPGDAQSVQVIGATVYVADGSGGLQIIDVSNPRNPVRIGGYDTPGGALALQVVGQTAFIADSTYCLEIIDVSDPAHPLRLGGFRPVGYREVARSVQVVGSTAFLTDGDLIIVDVSDPTLPTFIRREDIMGNAKALRVQGNYAYFAAGDPFMMTIYNISEPTQPQYIATLEEFSTLADNICVAGQYACIAEMRTGLYVIDVRDPSHPQRVGFYAMSGSLGVDMADGCAYMALGSGGVTVLNLTDPAHPVRATGYDTPGYANSVRVVGNYVFVADGTNGLAILEAQPLQPPKMAIAQMYTNVLLSWPASALGFSPVFKTDLNATTWSPVAQTPGSSNDVFAVSVPAAGAQLFRLQRLP